jgi:hypothetical protein
MPAKIARSAARPPFGLPEMLVAVHTSRLSCREAEKAPIFTPVQESSGESKLILSRADAAEYAAAMQLRGEDFAVEVASSVADAVALLLARGRLTLTSAP